MARAHQPAFSHQTHHHHHCHRHHRHRQHLHIIIIIMVYREQNSTHPQPALDTTKHINIIIININNGMVYSDIS